MLPYCNKSACQLRSAFDYLFRPTQPTTSTTSLLSLFLSKKNCLYDHRITFDLNLKLGNPWVNTTSPISTLNHLTLQLSPYHREPFNGVRTTTYQHGIVIGLMVKYRTRDSGTATIFVDIRFLTFKHQ